MAGRFGKIFFLYHYSSIEEKYKKSADLLLEKYLDDLSGYSYLPYTYCTGIAGVGIGMYILADNGYISFDADFFDDIDVYLTQMLHTEIRKIMLISYMVLLVWGFIL